MTERSVNLSVDRFGAALALVKAADLVSSVEPTMIKVANGILVKKAVIGAVLRSVIQPSYKGAPGVNYSTLKSIRRHAERTGGFQVSPELKDQLAQGKSLGILMREGIQGPEKLKPPKISYNPSGSYTSSKVRTPAANTPTIGHELGHYVQHSNKIDSGERGFFGLGGKPSTNLPSEAYASNKALEALRAAGASTPFIRHAGADLAGAYDTYATSARFNPEGHMFLYSAPESERPAYELYRRLSEGFKQDSKTPKRLKDKELPPLVAHYKKKKLAAYPSVRTAGTGNRSLKDLRDKYYFHPYIESPKSYSDWNNTALLPVTAAQRLAAEQYTNAFVIPDKLNNPRQLVNEEAQQAAANRQQLMKNLNALGPEQQATLRNEIKRYLTQTGQTFGREARRGTIQELRKLRNEYRAAYPPPPPPSPPAPEVPFYDQAYDQANEYVTDIGKRLGGWVTDIENWLGAK